MKTVDELRIYKREWVRNKRGRTNSSMENSTTYKGRRAELLAVRLLKGSKDMNNNVMNRPYDIEWNGLKIDVKSCELYKRKKKRGKECACNSGWWVFNKNKNDAEWYLCICLKDNKPIRYYLIPLENFSKGIAIGQRSEKFDKYLINL
jgi:hypothetical protein